MPRPPKNFSEQEVVKLGEDLLKWVANEGVGNTQFVRWYYCKHKMFKDDWKALKQREKFLPYHDAAMKIMAENITLNKDVAQSYGNRYLCYYDRDLLEHEEAIKDRDAARKTKEGSSIEEALEAVEHLKAVAASIRKESPSENKAS